MVDRYQLRLPLPPRLAAVARRHHPKSSEEWLLLTPRHEPADTLGGHLEFALKWEGVDLSVLTHLFRTVSPDEVGGVVREKPTGIYTRRLWFLYEWLTGGELDLPDLGKVRSVPAIDPDRQFATEGGPLSSRHKVVDNLPGTRQFCPLVRRTEMLDRFRKRRLDERAREVIGRTHPDILARAAAFLLLDDSRSSFQIEGERPPQQRTARWGQAIAEAGSQPLSIDELERLQRIVIGDPRFVHLGLREEGGFVGSHDRVTGEPIPDHISARPDDLENLLRGLAEYGERSVKGGMDPVVAAAVIAFGFVYIHPFEDGNGRLHRWLIHHVLAIAGYNPPGIVFPISAASRSYPGSTGNRRNRATSRYSDRRSITTATSMPRPTPSSSFTAWRRRWSETSPARLPIWRRMSGSLRQSSKSSTCLIQPSSSSTDSCAREAAACRRELERRNSRH